MERNCRLGNIVLLKMRRKYVLVLNGLIVAVIIGWPIYNVMFAPEHSWISRFIFISQWEVMALIAAVLVAHFVEPNADLGSALLAALPAVFGIAAFFGILYVGRHDVDVVRASLFLVMYAASLFVILSDLLLAGAAAYLTKARGERWVKEMDYVYFGLGALGVFGTLTRSDMFVTSLNNDLIGPMVLATAIVVRLIKTRAEIGGWNKPPTDTNVPTPPPSPI
jgi:hypothetical protein